jgi:sugar phosphate isomerase/epimerase
MVSGDMDQQINKSTSRTTPPSGCLEIGVMVNNLERDRLKAFRVAADLGFRRIHTNGLQEKWLTGPERDEYIAAARAGGLTIDTMFVAFAGQSYADLPTIRRTVGLTNPATREHRCMVALAYGALAVELGAPSLAAHVGFIPEDRSRRDYADLLYAVQKIADGCAERGLTFHLETGQESAGILLQFLHDLDRPNVGVNFDPANFLLYDTDEPLSALDCLVEWVRGVHCKDGLRPEQAGFLGREVPIGHGAVNFPALLRKLLDIGYRGSLIMERENGPNAVQEIVTARSYLENLLIRAKAPGRGDAG